MSLIDINQVQVIYPGSGKPALNRVSAVIGDGEITQFLGKSGSGKTTLLKCIGNLHSFEGSITYKGESIKDMSPQRRASHIGYVSQSFDLFPHMNVLENCVHPQTHVLGIGRSEAREFAVDRLTHLGMGDFLKRNCHHLSGGQKQRVSIARSLCMRSKVLLLDEPTSALDPESSQNLMNVLLSLQDSGVTIVLSTHDMTFSKALKGKTYVMKNGNIVEG